jgi:hypothetical protein
MRSSTIVHVLHRVCIHPVFGFCVAAACGVPAPAATVDPSAAPKAAALLKRYCAECHADGAEEGGVSLDKVHSFADAKPDLWAAMHEQLQLGLMPPKEADARPSADERAWLVAWIAESMKAAGQHVNNKLEMPNYGNYVPHDPLFRGPAHPAPATRIRLWRQRPDFYTKRSGGGTQAFSMQPGQQFADFASLYVVDESAAEIVLRNAEQLVRRWTPTGSEADSKGPRKPQPPTPLIMALVQADAPSQQQFQGAINYAFTFALDRVATADELVSIRGLYDRVREKHGAVQAARAALAVPLLEPEAVYRLELGSGELDEHGRRRLSKDEILTAVANTLLTAAAKPAAIVEARKNKAVTLASRDDVAAFIAELLPAEADPAKQNPRLLTFFDEYFDFPKATEVFKDVPRGLPFGRTAFVADTRRLIAKIVADDKDVLKALLTTNKSSLSGQGADRPAFQPRLYGLPADYDPTIDFVDLDPEQRAGILTQPAWLVAHSGNFDNDPVRRGKWILERLLGGTVPDVPVTVCANVPADDTKTLRERFKVVSDDSYCWKCHEQMNSLGMPFEHYDHYGRYRFLEKKKPVDTIGAVIASGDPAIDGPVDDPVEMIHRIAKSKRVQEVFVRHAFRFFLGRNETLSDAQTLRDANEAYEKSGGSFRTLVISLLSSDSFLYRTAEP